MQVTNLIVEFYLVDAFEIFHFLPLYEKLMSIGIDARFVAEKNEINISGNWFDYDEAISIFDGLELPYSEYANSGADFAITTQDATCLQKYIHAKKISYPYGLSLCKNYYMHSDRKAEGFSYLFVHGDFSKQLMSKKFNDKNIEVIGFPKHYSMKKVTEKYKYELKDELSIQTDKPILVYFPTWDADSSVKFFSDAIEKLRNKYFIVVKSHHCTYRLPSLRSELEKLKEIGNLILPGNYSFEKASSLADVMLIDGKSGSSMEAAYINPQAKIVLLSPRTDMKSYYYPEVFELYDIINLPDNLTKFMEQKDEKINIRNSCIENFLGKKHYDYLSDVISRVFTNKSM